MTLSEDLKRFASPEQWIKVQSVLEHGSKRKAAKALGINESSIRKALKLVLRKAAQQGFAPDYGITHELPEGLALKGTSIRFNAKGDVETYWNKSRIAGRDPEDVFQIPDPRKVVKVSTLYDQQGAVTQQWISERPADEERERLWQTFAKALADDLPRAERSARAGSSNGDLLACYPVGDHHLGMLSWSEETGADYDLSIGEKALMSATDYLIAAAPSCEQALVVLLGDFLHYDSFEAVTPTSRNILDSDSRYPKMVRVAIRSARYLIEAALRHHQNVHVIVEIGNHDLSSSIFLMECLANIYENEPRITVDTSPSHFHYYEFGSNLIGTHHGHGVKLEKLPLLMATDRPEAWGRTLHRIWLTGHIHSRTAQDFGGCTVESFRVLPPVDAWAAQKGYRSARDMKSILFHRTRGEVARHTCSADMALEAA